LYASIDFASFASRRGTRLIVHGLINAYSSPPSLVFQGIRTLPSILDLGTSFVRNARTLAIALPVLPKEGKNMCQAVVALEVAEAEAGVVAGVAVVGVEPSNQRAP
jgi:hypothetical protein